MIMKKLITIFVLSIIYIAPTFALEKKDVNLDEDLSGNFLYCWEKTKSGFGLYLGVKFINSKEVKLVELYRDQPEFKIYKSTYKKKNNVEVSNRLIKSTTIVIALADKTFTKIFAMKELTGLDGGTFPFISYGFPLGASCRFAKLEEPFEDYMKKINLKVKEINDKARANSN